MKIVHISDVHFGFELLKDKVEKAIKQINEIEPDLVVLTGDIGLWGVHHEFRDAYETLSSIKSEILAVPGNHDARNDGLKYFRLYFGRTRKRVKVDNAVFIGVDSTLPDSDEGYVGDEQREWILSNVRKNCINIVVMHHHLVPIPHTGRNMNVLIDAAEMVEALAFHCHGGVVLAGHRHVPYSTKLLRTHVIHAGSLSSYKVLMPDNNYNVIEFDEEAVKLELRFIDLGGVEIGKFKLKPEIPESIDKYRKLTSTKRVLFISVKNDLRTKIAEYVFNKVSPDNMYAISCGTSPSKSLSEIAVEFARKRGVKLTKPKKLTEEMLEDADYVISLDENVDVRRIDEVWNLAIPNSYEEALKLCEVIEGKVKELIRNLLLS